MANFEMASRGKFRFPYKGNVSVEDLWDLSVTDLDSIYKVLNSQVKQAKEESLLATKSKEDEILSAKIDVVKYIVSVKVEEDNARLKAKETREKKQKIMAVLAEKQDNDLRNKSTDELMKMLEEM